MPKPKKPDKAETPASPKAVHRERPIYGGADRVQPKDHSSEPSIQVKQFKLEDGREGSYAPLGNGLIKVLFDDGNMVIAVDVEAKRGEQDPSDEIPF